MIVHPHLTRKILRHLMKNYLLQKRMNCPHLTKKIHPHLMTSFRRLMMNCPRPMMSSRRPMNWALQLW
jgi:hypothetical protein